MTTLQEVHQYDFGTQFIITVTEDGTAVDISSATVKKMLFGFRDGTTLVVNATFLTDGTDGKLAYVTTDGNMSVVGNAWVQVFISISGGEWYSEKEKFIIKDNIKTVDVV